MNAIKLLKNDHKKVKDLFRQYGAAGDSTKKKDRIAEEVFTELEIHSMIEEEIFYPAVKAKADQEGQKLVDESLEEHQVVASLIEELQELDPEDEEFNSKFQTLMDNVEYHVEQEEGELFPIAEEQLGDKLDDLGVEMEEYKEQLMVSAE